MVTLENHIGTISVSENYLTEIVRHAVCDCFGVADVCNISPFRSAVSAITRGKLFSRKGVLIRTDDSNGIIIDLHIKVSYGTNIAVAVQNITHKVIFTVEEATGLEVHGINVFADDMNA